MKSREQQRAEYQALMGRDVAGSSKQPRKLSKDEQRALDDKNARAKMNSDRTKILGMLDKQPALKSALATKEAKQLQSEAYGTGPLAEYESMRAQARGAADQARTRLGQGLSDEIQSQSIAGAGAQANAYSQLAQEGGLSSGARERIASGGTANQMMQAQQARLQNSRQMQENDFKLQDSMLGLSGNEAKDRRGMQNTYLQLQQGDIGSQNQFNQNKFDKKLGVQTDFMKAGNEYNIGAMNRK
jgi:hypothetical protein